jgi:hypothetical protein
MYVTINVTVIYLAACPEPMTGVFIFVSMPMIILRRDLLDCIIIHD